MFSAPWTSSSTPQNQVRPRAQTRCMRRKKSGSRRMRLDVMAKVTMNAVQTTEKMELVTARSVDTRTTRAGREVVAYRSDNPAFEADLNTKFLLTTCHSAHLGAILEEFVAVYGPMALQDRSAVPAAWNACARFLALATLGF